MSCKSIFYFLLFFFTCAFFYHASAQKTETRSVTYPIDAFKTQQIETVALFDEKKADDFLSSFLKYKDADISFNILNTTESKKAKHYLYQILYKGIEVFNAQIKLSVLQNGKVNSCFINEFPIPSSAIFLDSNTIKKHIPTLSQIQKYTITPVYFFDGEKTIPTNRINYLHNNWDNIEIIVNANNEIIYQNNLNSFLTTPTDSLVKAKVFMPDPLTSAQQNYASPYNDQSDADVTELNDQRNFVDMRVTFDNDTFWLYNDFVKITRFSAPDIDPVAVSTLSTFNYTRNQSQFEDVNVYYHLNQYNKYLKSLGFTNLVNYQIWVDTHALNGQDNSMFSSATTPARLFFGEGGVDDGEDADVILHEYGHAISHSAAPNTNNGTERKTLDEANGDYFAASFSKTISDFKWDQVYTWDGHNEFWNGRMASTTKLYSQLSFPSIYTNTDIWSGTLMEIESVIGRNVLHEIVLESMHSYASNITMAQAAWLLVKADSALNNGANYAVICPKIKAREFTSTCPVIDGMNENIKSNATVRVINSEGFSNGECLQIMSNFNNNKISLLRFDGTEVYSESYLENEYKLCASNYSKGIYFLKITSNNITHTYKLIKF